LSRKPPDPFARITPYALGASEEEFPSVEGSERPLKLASNENSLGPSKLAVEAARRAMEQSHRYPDGSGRLLRGALANRLNLPSEQILLGNGSTELVELLSRTFLVRGGWAVMARQSFIMYRIAVRAARGRCREIPLREMRHDLEAMARACNPETGLVYIANPNNPTGTYVTTSDMERYFRCIPDSVITVLDEAYAEYLDRPDYPSGLNFLRQGMRVVVLRTFSKAYGLAGLRVGYALAPVDVIGTMEKIRSPFNTNRIGQAAALAALADSEHLERSRESNQLGLRFLEEAFRGRGMRFTPSVANFLLVHFDRPGEEVYASLLQDGVITRPMGPYDFPNALRITVGTPAENARLLSSLDRFLGPSRGRTSLI